ncbi:tumor necrosis factor receptor superfamily member 3 [Phycodurus eques]|uniref:tumor necrosis factor receptor superfamily member 3 n=1 Tax=Phycodurus eques TaxID=693459 RepID=UPI002ACDC9AE|nr:tumor necrosis factor receptor superfamily member 3 [Phycodurus eques]
MCPPGEFQKSCEQCAPCPAKSYTTDWNREESCLRCYGDCRPEFNQEVIEDCSSTSNLKCTCQDGFRCTAVVAYTGNCKNCVATTTVTAAAAAAATTDEDEQTPSSSSSGSRSNSARLCSFPECEAEPGNSSHANKGPQLVAVVFPMVVVVTVALTVWLCICRRGEETCLKRGQILYNMSISLAPSCGILLPRNHVEVEGVPNVTAKEKEPNQHFLTDPCGAVHVHNAGTVIFSWLSQFTGQVGPVTETKMATKDEEKEAEDGDQAPPPSFSPSVPLSEEEMSGEAVLFPSQEEGKDWHVSKEEAES